MGAPTVTDISELLDSRAGVRGGRPCLRGTRITVHNVAMHYNNGASVEQMVAYHPDLGAAPFHAALAYYFANKEQVDTEIETDLALELELAARHPRAWTRDDLLRGD